MNVASRQEIRDAAFFHHYGISRDDTDYILDTCPIVRKNDEKAHGEYRTKRVILEVYDALAIGCASLFTPAQISNQTKGYEVA